MRFAASSSSVSNRVDARATQRDADLDSLAALHASWSRTLDLARSADAPPELLDRAQSALAMIGTVRGAVEQRRAKLLVLQDATSRALQTCDEARARILDVRRAAIERVVTPQQPPLWRSGPSLRPELAAGFSLASGLAVEGQNIAAYVATYRAGVALIDPGGPHPHGAVASGALDDLGWRFHRVGVASALQTPFASAILLGLLITRPFRPNPPFAFQQVMLAVVTAATVFVLRPIVGTRLSRLLYAFAALLFFNLATSVLQMPGRLEQVVRVAEMLATTLLLLWGAARLEDATLPSTGEAWIWKAARTFARIVALGCAVSALAAALGYLDLADFLGIGLFYGLFVALGLLAVRITLDGLVPIALEHGPLARLRTATRHRAMIARRARRALDVAAVAIWVWFMLGRFELLEPVSAGLRGHPRGAPPRRRARPARSPTCSLRGRGDRRLRRHPRGGDAARGGRLLADDAAARGALRALDADPLRLPARGFLLALATLGLDLTRITVLVSALGLGLGFGLQQIMNNFVSGLILLFERPVQVGDSIQMGDLAGEVLRIGIRSSTVRTAAGRRGDRPELEAHRGEGHQLDALGPPAAHRARHRRQGRRRCRADHHAARSTSRAAIRG